jgi:hypothetical protein
MLPELPLKQPPGVLVMSDRERWIVYPLLFLALGSSISTKFIMQHQVETQYLKCRAITIESADGQTQLGLVPQDGNLYAHNRKSHEIWPLIGTPSTRALDALRRSLLQQQSNRQSSSDTDLQKDGIEPKSNAD